jgi:hypothetical protein
MIVTMDTLVEALTRLQASGYAGSWSARPGGRLACAVCGGEMDALDMVVDKIMRFEGPSDPGDESILYALTGQCGDLGVYISAYGPYACDLHVEVAGRLPR